MQPGDTITPHQPDSDEQAKPEVEQPEPKPEHTEHKAKAHTPDAKETPEPSQTWKYHAEAAVPATTSTSTQSVNWSASEYIDHQKATSWYLGLIVVTVLACGLIFWLTHDLITLVVIAIAAALFGVAGARKPRTLEYELNNRGVQIGAKFYDYAGFKSFTVLEEGAINSIQLLPLKRFMPPISLYCPPEQEDAVVGLIGSYLPHEERSSDPIDSLMRKVRF